MCGVERPSTARRQLARSSEVVALQVVVDAPQRCQIAFLHPLGNGVLHPDEDTLHVGSCDHPDERTLLPEQTSVRFTA